MLYILSGVLNSYIYAQMTVLTVHYIKLTCQEENGI